MMSDNAMYDTAVRQIDRLERLVADMLQAQHKQERELERLRALNADLLAALREVVTINEESAGDCRRRMGTRRGNSIVTARAAIAKAEGR